MSSALRISSIDVKGEYLLSFLNPGPRVARKRLPCRCDASHHRPCRLKLPELRAVERSASRATGSSERASPSPKGRSTELADPQAQRQRIDGVFSPSPRRLSFSSEDIFMPDTAAEAILDFLPAPQALSIMARSRSVERRVKCSRYCLSRLDKMVSSLAAAEEAYHQVRPARIGTNQTPCASVEIQSGRLPEGVRVRKLP